MENQGISIDGTPLIGEMVKTQALIRTLISVLLSQEQKDSFNEKYPDQYRKALRAFIEDNPGRVTGEDDLLKRLEDAEEGAAS